MSILDGVVKRIASSKFQKTIADTKGLIDKVPVDLRPSFNRLIDLAQDSMEHGHPQRAGIELRKARKLAGVTAAQRVFQGSRKGGVYRVRLNQGGYDSHGRYFGTGVKLWSQEDPETGHDKFVRAPTLKEAKKLFADGHGS